MQMQGNTILITGGGSGIGRGLAEAFHKLGNKVVIAGRRQAALDETVAANPGMRALPLDIQSAQGIRDFATQIAAEFPQLNVLINNAGIMRRENLAAPRNLADAEAVVATNLLGPIRLTDALLPVLRRQARPVIMNVSSGLAFVPMAATATYCATKAGLHSYTMSLRYQLAGTPAQVLELVPPYVQTELLDGKNDPRAMPLDKFIGEVMEILRSQPEALEVCVENVKRLRYAATRAVEGIFRGMNDAMARNPH